MAMIDLDVDLSDEERKVHDTVHRFAAEVMRPAGIALDRLPDPADVIAPQSVLWDVFKKYRALGLDVYTDPSSDVPPLQRARLRYIISEELGWGDAGLAISLGVAAFPRMMAQLSGKPELIERFGDPNAIGCWGGTEPHHGSDFILFGDKIGTPAYGKPDCVARKQGDCFVISGQKAAWVSNGTIAAATALFCAVDLGNGVHGSGGFLVPLDVPGVSRGKPLDKIGQRALNQGEIFFDDVRVPASYLVLGPELFAFATDTVLSQANSGMGSMFVGVAQAALDLAIEYAKQRVQGGVPIIQHQSVQARLFDVFRKVEAARSLARRVMVYNTTTTPPALPYAIASKVTATTTAFEVASAAVQIFGGNGLSREYPIEKLLRDARASMIEDGCNEVLGLVAAERLGAA
jgi:acyl-CoA dehydrogenase